MEDSKDQAIDTIETSNDYEEPQNTGMMFKDEPLHLKDDG